MSDYGALYAAILMLAGVWIAVYLARRRTAGILSAEDRRIVYSGPSADAPDRAHVRGHRRVACGDSRPGTNDDDLAWLLPPPTLTDASAWDRYWHDQLTRAPAGLALMFAHLFCDDGLLVDVMRANGLRTVLCVGNGISQEPHALAWAGCDVVALDLSPYATEVAKVAAPSDLLAGLVGGRSGERNGHVEFLVGDLCDKTCCPGPYDVVIDRRTLQLYPDDRRSSAMQAVADRLAPTGIFFSQCHDGGWRPPEPRRHVLEPWFLGEGWRVWLQPEQRLTGRVAWLLVTTG